MATMSERPQALRSRYTFAVRRSDRARRSRLTISEGGDVIVVLPRRAPRADADRLVTRHAAWIERHVGRVREERARLDLRPPLGAGRALDVDGITLRVWVDRASTPPPARGSVHRAGERLQVSLGTDGRDAAAIVETWLRARARARIVERVAAHADSLAVIPGRITIRDQRSRWASASRNGDLSFSWRLILAPPYVLEAVVVHELAHLRVRGHSGAFWAIVRQHAPRTPEARRWLRDHAREVRAALA
jgi:predicted metal-dependent hydrolase